MINKKLAFTLIEVLLAMTILTISLFIISNLQTRVLNKVLFERDRLEHIFLLKCDKIPEDGKKIIMSNEDPKVVAHTQDIQDKSILKELKKNIKFLKIYATWKKDGEACDLSIMGLVFKPAKKEKEKMELK